MRGKLAATIALLWAAGIAAAPALQSVQLRASAHVSGDWVTLAELAIVAPKAQAALAALAIAPAPPPGGTRNVSLGYLKLRLRRAGVDLSGVTFSGPDRVAVSRGGRSAASSGPTSRAGASAKGLARETLRRGATVKLVLRRGALVVETSGDLLRDCAIGDLGKFRVDKTRAIVSARLTDRMTAEVVR